MKINKKEIYIIVSLVVLCAVLFFYKLGSYKLIDVDEPRYAEAAREMIESGDWITPYFNYQLRFDKPVFHYWLIASSYLTFGISEFAARFPSAILASILVFFTYFLGRRTVAWQYGLISAAILASSLEFMAIARMSITDMTLAFFISTGIMFGFMGAFTENVYKKYWWWLSYLMCGIAVLTKGPVGLLLPVAVVGIYLLLTGKVKESLNPKYLIPGILLFIASVVPWYYSIIKVHGMDFVKYFFIKHNLKRFSSTDLGHVQPFYFYFTVVFAGFFPWIAYFIASMFKFISECFNKFKQNVSIIKSFDFAIFKDSDNFTKIKLFSFIWFLIIFVFFSGSTAKLLTYILPLFPALALFTGTIWYEYIIKGEHKKVIYSASWFTFVLCLVLAFVQLFAFASILPREVKTNSSGVFNLSFMLILIIIPVIAMYFIQKDKREKAFISFIALMVGICSSVVNNIMPVVYSSGQKDLIQYVEFIKNSKYQDKKFVTYSLTKPSLVFYLQKRVPNIKNEEQDKLIDVLKDKTPVFIVLKEKQIEELSKKVKFNVVKHGVRYSLISNVNDKIVEVK